MTSSNTKVKVQSEVKVRIMVDSDLPRLNEIDRLIQGEDRVTTWPYSLETYRTIYNPNLTLVCEVDGEVMGFLVGYILTPPTRSKRVGWIEMLGVHPESQNKGVGRQLVEKFHEECRRNDAVVNCLVRLNDETLAKFYASLGFKPFDFIIYTKQ